MICNEINKSDYWRTVMYLQLQEQLASIVPVGSGVEFGGSNGVIQSMCPDVRFETRYYPKYDVLDTASWKSGWDVIVADQMLEHVKRPWEVFDNLAKHTKQVAVITVPFLALVHPCPDDYWRITQNGIKELAGNNWASVEVRSWGNKRAVRWLAEYAFDMPSLLENVPMNELLEVLDENDNSLPVMIWAVMRK
jgi:hypothetical protein